ncbi:MAG: Ig-like domain-containing protein [Anaerolineae bacterium]|nr:Ig-like domain-containing protein [Anaerolineae bacterium]
MKERGLWVLAALLALWTYGALGQLETVTDQGVGPAWIAPGETAITQVVKVTDNDEDALQVTLTKVRVENVLGSAVASDFAKIEILDGADALLGSASYPFSFPLEIDITDQTIGDDGTFTLKVQVTVATGIVGHRTIRTRLIVEHTEDGSTYYKGVDDLVPTTINNPPVAAHDSYTVNEDATLTVTAPGVLGNDSDLDGDSLTAALLTGPANGTLNLNPDGSFTYTPNPNFSGADSFTYKAYDGRSESNVATVTITVNPVNDAPVAQGDTYETDEDTPLVVDVPGVLANDSDPDGDSLTAVLYSEPLNGQLTLNPDGSFIYTPNQDFFGTDSFVYYAWDGTASSGRTLVVITVNPVNDAPVAQGDTYETDEDTPLVVNAPGVLGNDSDPDGDSLTALHLFGPWNGSLTLNSDGSFTYNPNPNFFGVDGFYYYVFDGTAASQWAYVTITVNPVNDPPVAVDDSYSMNEDSSLTIPGPGVLSNDTDPDGNPLTAELVSGPAKGTVNLNPNGSFTYTPNPNFFGTDSFTYRAYDGEFYSGVATVTITVVNVNDPPTAQNDTYTVDEDTTLTVNVPGVLRNDSDPDGDSLAAAFVSGPTNGMLTLNQDGSFTYKPNPNFFGTDSFKYKAYDGQLYSDEVTVTITVNPVNDAPTAQADLYTLNEDTQLTVQASGVLGNDSDIEGDTLTAVLVSGPAHGTLTLNQDGSFTYTPNPDFFGTDSFKYKAYDGQLYSDEVTVTINVTMVPYGARLTLPVGWNMVSVPLKPIAPNNTPTAVFGDDISPLFIFRWNPSTGQYETPATIDPGHGYWVYIMTEGITVDIEGAQRIDGNYEVALPKAGWHMISTPTVNVYWGYCKFKKGTETKTYDEAISAGWIGPYLFRWNPAENKYTYFTAAGVIEPWVGYWIRTYADDLVLVLPVGDARPPLPPESALAPAADPSLTPPPPPTLPMMDKATGLSIFNYPNPVRDVHTTKFVVLGAGVEAIRVSVYDLAGRLVWRGEALGHELTWHTDDLTGKFLANGVYLYVVEVKVGGSWVRSEVKRLVILR